MLNLFQHLQGKTLKQVQGDVIQYICDTKPDKNKKYGSNKKHGWLV